MADQVMLEEVKKMPDTWNMYVLYFKKISLTEGKKQKAVWPYAESEVLNSKLFKLLLMRVM